MSTAVCPECGAEVRTSRVFTDEACPSCEASLASLIRLAQTEVDV